jgi:hypothetical protein
MSTNELLKAVEQLGPDDMEEFTSQVIAMRAQRRAGSLSLSESEFLEEINRGMPGESRCRLEELVARRQDEALSSEEHQELLQLTKQLESLEAERARHLVDLASLRGVSLSELLEQLGISASA